MHLLLEEGLLRRLVPNLDVLTLNVLLDSLHDPVVFESSLQLGVGPLALQALDELRLDEHQNATDLAVGLLVGQLDLVGATAVRG